MSRIEFPLRVMEPILVEILPVGNYFYQVKWDGMRWITYRQGKGIDDFLFHTKGQKVFRTRFAELLPNLGWLPPDSIVDGEVVILRDGKPHFPSLLRRIQGGSERSGRRGFVVEGLEVEYVVFDVIRWEGKDLRQQVLAERLALLEKSVPKSGRCQAIETFHNGEGLWQGVKELELEGIVAKDPLSPYRPGKDSAWLKIKNWRVEEFMIGGVKFRQGLFTSVCLGTWSGAELLYVGSVSSGVSRLSRQIQEAKSLIRAESPFTGSGPGLAAGEEVVWAEPIIPVKVRFLEWTDEGKFRHGQII